MMIIEMCTRGFNMIIMNKIESDTTFTSWSPLVDIVVSIDIVWYCCCVDHHEDTKKNRRIERSEQYVADTPLKQDSRPLLEQMNNWMMLILMVYFLRTHAFKYWNGVLG